MLTDLCSFSKCVFFPELRGSRSPDHWQVTGLRLVCVQSPSQIHGSFGERVHSAAYSFR